MKATRALPIALAFTVLSSLPAFALSSWFPSHNGGGGGGGSVSHSAPGPVIGLGLPAAVAFGGFVWLRRRARNAKNKK